MSTPKVSLLFHFCFLLCIVCVCVLYGMVWKSKYYVNQSYMSSRHVTNYLNKGHIIFLLIRHNNVQIILNKMRVSKLCWSEVYNRMWTSSDGRPPNFKESFFHSLISNEFVFREKLFSYLVTINSCLFEVFVINVIVNWLGSRYSNKKQFLFKLNKLKSRIKIIISRSYCYSSLPMWQRNTRARKLETHKVFISSC